MANNEKKTLVVIALDESGSMMSYVDRTISSYNELVMGQKANKETKAYLALVKFNFSGVKLVHGVRPIETADNLDRSNYNPCGGTPLYDAVNLAIQTADDQETLFDQIIIVIMTDGEENQSRTTTLQTIRVKISEREAKDKWTFVYIGENPQRWARDTGMPLGNTMAYRPGQERVQMQAVLGGINNARGALQSGDLAAQKQSKKSFFKAYLEREGPKNLGTVQWPAPRKGALTGQKFLLTGVLETITYEDCVQLIKDCDGGFMTVVSPKLTYLIVGREAGPKKLETAVAKAVNQIDEGAFFKYITDMINNVGPSPSPFGTPTVMAPSAGDVDPSLAQNPPAHNPITSVQKKKLADAAARKAAAIAKRATTKPSKAVATKAATKIASTVKKAAATKAKTAKKATANKSASGKKATTKKTVAKKNTPKKRTATTTASDGEGPSTRTRRRVQTK